ncbi:MAG: tetratricopeptide repeat protein [Candidatus Cloacimonetes bacterium]|nr:tetratricopeptide repeat protein [Candidatus Cloacimonadota bacterium]
MEEIKKVLVKARHARKINWLKAQKLLSESLKIYPESAELAIELADIYFQQRLYRQAINTCQTALLYTDNEELLIIIANCFLSMREYHIANSYFQRVKQESPELLYNQAVSLARTKQFEEAIRIAQKVVDYRIKSPVPYILLAELYYNQKEYHKAISCCNQAQVIAGLSSDVCFLRGMSWLAQQNLLKAYWDFHQGEIFKIGNSEYYRSYGIVCEGIGKTDKAIELLRKAIDIAPQKPGAYLELIRIYLVHNMLDSAGELLAAARNSLPEDFPLAIMYNRIIDGLTQSQS